MKQYKAENIHWLVSDTIAKGKPHWPTSRTALLGLRLRQVSDAIMIFMAQVYIRTLSGEVDERVYPGLKQNWPNMLYILPGVFVRQEDFEEAQHIQNPAERHLWLMRLLTKYYDESNEEEEFQNAESFASFIKYIEALPKDDPNIFPHVLGRISTRYIYTDDTIPVLSGQAS